MRAPDAQNYGGDERSAARNHWTPYTQKNVAYNLCMSYCVDCEGVGTGRTIRLM